MSQKERKLVTESSVRLQQRARIELFISISIVILLVVLSSSFEVEFVESLYQFTRAHEDWELDEIIFSFLWVAVVAVVYSTRRVLDIIKINKETTINAYYDVLTGLPNRHFSQEQLGRLIYEAKRYQQLIVVIFLDLNDFKDVNDTYGHDCGDILIKKVGQRLAENIRQEEIVSRLGGDEFLIVCKFPEEQRKDIDVLIKRIHACQLQPFDLKGNFISITFSIGVAISPDNGESVNSLMVAADSAMYEAKRNKSAAACYYTDDIGDKIKERVWLSTNLKAALAKKELYLVFQPIVNTAAGTIEGYEALSRWELDGVHINPELIVSLAESVGLTEIFFCWLIDAALEEGADFLAPDQFISVNVSAKQFLDTAFMANVRSAIENYSYIRIELEITESSLLTDHDETSLRIAELNKLGIKVMIDDFGTGYSSLSRLKNLEVDKIKIDRSFLVDAEVDKKSARVFESIIELANRLNITVVVEGVETVEQLRFINQYSPSLVQGFLFQKPVKKELLISEIVAKHIILDS